MYVGVPSVLYPAAARSVYAHVLQLVAQGRIVARQGTPSLEGEYGLP
jgi:hypothetical protein